MPSDVKSAPIIPIDGRIEAYGAARIVDLTWEENNVSNKRIIDHDLAIAIAHNNEHGTTNKNL